MLPLLLRRALSLVQRARCSASRVSGRPFVPPGVHIGSNGFIGRHAELDWSHGMHIHIEDHATIVSGARVIRHDAAAESHCGITRVAPVRICRRAFVDANAVVLPSVTIGSDAIVGAGSVVTGDVPAGVVVAGNPARPIGFTADLVTRRLADASRSRVFPPRLYNTSPLPAGLARRLDDAGRDGEYYLASDEAMQRFLRATDER